NTGSEGWAMTLHDAFNSAEVALMELHAMASGELSYSLEDGFETMQRLSIAADLLRIAANEKG
ncbi:MAG: hypothetical protein AB8B85_01665, partial [Paracoccaceae bacterium]